MSFTREERIEQLKDACDSIKEHAADFIGEEPFPCNWKFIIQMDCHALTTVKVERESIPHKMIKKL